MTKPSLSKNPEVPSASGSIQKPEHSQEELTQLIKTSRLGIKAQFENKDEMGPLHVVLKAMKHSRSIRALFLLSKQKKAVLLALRDLVQAKLALRNPGELLSVTLVIPPNKQCYLEVKNIPRIER